VTIDTLSTVTATAISLSRCIRSRGRAYGHCPTGVGLDLVSPF
jgi:hypothetical protein